MKFFRLASAVSDIKIGNNKRCVFIDGNEISDASMLYELLSSQLDFPDYFGENLDALYDMLVDLQWIKQDTIELVITNFSAFLREEPYNVKADIMLIFEDAIACWKEGDFDDEEWSFKNFKVYLIGDESVRTEVRSLLEEE